MVYNLPVEKKTGLQNICFNGTYRTTRRQDQLLYLFCSFICLFFWGGGKRGTKNCRQDNLVTVGSNRSKKYTVLSTTRA